MNDLMIYLSNLNFLGRSNYKGTLAQIFHFIVGIIDLNLWRFFEITAYLLFFIDWKLLDSMCLSLELTKLASVWKCLSSFQIGGLDWFRDFEKALLNTSTLLLVLPRPFKVRWNTFHNSMGNAGFHLSISGLLPLVPFFIFQMPM